MDISKIVVPGSKLGLLPNFEAGEHTATCQNKYIIANTVGIAVLTKDAQSSKPRISVSPLISTRPFPNVGDEVFGEVMGIKRSGVNIKIRICAGKTLEMPFFGIIRLKDVFVDAVEELRLEEIFEPGDIIKAIIVFY